MAALNQWYGTFFIEVLVHVGNLLELVIKLLMLCMEANKCITKHISKAFHRFAPKGTGNIFVEYLRGAKNLYTAAKE